MKGKYYVREMPTIASGLGRHVEHDPESLRYLVPEPVAGQPLRSVRWVRHIEALDQGTLGGCTGYAMAGLLMTEPFASERDGLILSGPISTWLPSETDTDALARQLYSRATALDSIPGQWPDDDTGSTGLAVAKAARELGYISGYRHATSLTAALAALQEGPVITGVPWYEQMMEPESDGEVRPGGAVVGGHEFGVFGLDEDLQRVWCWQSWGPEWGLGGTFYLTFQSWERLLSEDGDVTVPVPTSAPAPTPAPGSAWPDIARAWVGRRHTSIGGNAEMARATREYLTTLEGS